VGMSATYPLNYDTISWNDCEWLIDDCTATVGNMISGEYCIKRVSKALFLFYDKNWVQYRVVASLSSWTMQVEALGINGSGR
jgi:hypothetical protein